MGTRAQHTMVEPAAASGHAGEAANGIASASKKSRWRKDRREAPAKAEQPQMTELFATAAVNQAAELAFKGLHGAKTQFSLLAGATDNVYRSVLGGNAYYYKEHICRADDFSMFEALVEELEYTPHWMQGGTPLHRPTALGTEESLRKSPTYEKIVRWLAGQFGVKPIRSIANFYRNGDDYTSFHSDQYFTGVNMTIGASFGEERALLFEHKESKEQFSFPQHNGDIFAFTDEVNHAFMHAVPRERRRAHSTTRCHGPGRVSVILWARREQPEWRRGSARLPLDLQPSPHIWDRDPNLSTLDDTDAAPQLEPGGEARVPAAPPAAAGDDRHSPPVAHAADDDDAAATVRAVATVPRAHGRFAKISTAGKATQAAEPLASRAPLRGASEAGSAKPAALRRN